MATCYSSDLKCVPPSLEIVEFLLQFLCVLHPPPHQLLTLRAQLLIHLLMGMNVASYTLQEKRREIDRCVCVCVVCVCVCGGGGGRLGNRESELVMTQIDVTIRLVKKEPL